MPIGAVQTASGYDVAWELPGANEYTVWTTDSNGNYTLQYIGVVSGNSYALESLETIFDQDLNGDGTIGLTTTVIQTRWIDQPDRGCERILSLQRQWGRSGAEIWRRRRCGG